MTNSLDENSNNTYLCRLGMVLVPIMTSPVTWVPPSWNHYQLTKTRNTLKQWIYCTRNATKCCVLGAAMLKYVLYNYQYEGRQCSSMYYILISMRDHSAQVYMYYIRISMRDSNAEVHIILISIGDSNAQVHVCVERE